MSGTHIMKDRFLRNIQERLDTLIKIEAESYPKFYGVTYGEIKIQVLQDIKKDAMLCKFDERREPESEHLLTDANIKFLHDFLGVCSREAKYQGEKTAFGLIQGLLKECAEGSWDSVEARMPQAMEGCGG